MSNLMASFNAGVSGLQSAQTSLNTTSHNIANAHTPGYTRQQVIITDSFYQNSLGAHNNMMQVGTGTVIVTTRQIRNTFLDARYRLEFGRQGFYEANQSTAREIEDMLGELEGEQFNDGIHKLWEEWNSLAGDPGNIVFKDQLVSKASQFVERAQVLRQELNTYQTSLNSEVMKQVDTINDLVSKIKELNKQIQRYEATGESANDYRDKRNEYLDELSYYIDFEVNEEKDGVITIYSQGAFLLDVNRQYFLSTEYEDKKSKQGAVSPLLKPVWEGGEDYFLDDSLTYSNKRKTDVGALRGLLVARGNYAANYSDTPKKPIKEDYDNERDYEIAMSNYKDEVEYYNNYTGASVVMTIQSQVDMLIHGLVTKINDILCPNKDYTLPASVTLEDGTVLAAGTTIQILDEENALMGDDKDNSIGVELFSRRGVDRYTEITVGGETVKMYNAEDETDMYSMYSIGQLVVNPVVLKDSSTIGTLYNDKTGNKDGYASDEILAISAAFHEDIGVLDPNSLTTYGSLDYYDAMVTDLSIQGSVWNGIISNQEVTVNSVNDERQNVMSVSTEEELSDLIKFQRCYDASSRYITTVAEMLEYLIERLG